MKVKEKLYLVQHKTKGAILNEISMRNIGNIKLLKKKKKG